MSLDSLDTIAAPPPKGRNRPLTRALGAMGNPVGALVNRAMLALRAGISFGGNRNLYTVFGYKETIRFDDYLSKYLRHPVAGRVIDGPVDATWTDGPHVKLKDEDWKEWNALVSNVSMPILPFLRKVDIFASIGHFAVLVVGLDDGKPLQSPVTKGTNRKITYLQPYMEANVAVDSFVTDETDPRFGLPLMYTITPGYVMTRLNQNVVASTARQPFRVHYSRVLHVADNCLENIVFGHSRLEGIFNDLDDLQKVSGGSAETYWLTANRGLHVDVDKDMELNETDASNLSDELDEYQHELRRVIRTRGVKVSSLGSDIADPTGTFAVLISNIASKTGFPQRVLMGAEAGQLASQQDRANWANRVDEREKNHVQPFILIPFINMLSFAGVLPEFDVSDLSVVWPDPFKMNTLERGQASAQQARSATNIARAMETGQKMQIDLFSAEEARTIVAPGTEILVLSPKPRAGDTFPPKLTQPAAEPVDPNSLTPEQQMEQTQISADATAEAAANFNGGGGNTGASGDTPVANARKRRRAKKSPMGYEGETPVSEE